MWRARIRIVAASIGVALVATACGGAESLDRADAIVALESTGVTTAEATCMADSLLLLDELDAVDPRIERGESERDALVGARNRCVGGAPNIEVAGVQQESATESGFTVERSTPQGSELEEFEIEQDDSLELAGSRTQLRTDAIAQLVRVGRSLDNATCVVDHILAAEDDHLVLVVETFGLGLEPIEAPAFVACSETI